jgi:holo-[acyl-carrier protein] synthase
MRIIGHGIDIVEVPRIARMIAAHGPRFLDRVYSAAEQRYCTPHRRSAEHFAARFAAKEAILKALGTGWSGGIAWTDAEVIPLESGAPTVQLQGRAAAVAAGLGITSWTLSMSDTEHYAFASAIAIGDERSASA